MDFKLAHPRWSVLQRLPFERSSDIAGLPFESRETWTLAPIDEVGSGRRASRPPSAMADALAAALPGLLSAAAATLEYIDPPDGPIESPEIRRLWNDIVTAGRVVSRELARLLPPPSSAPLSRASTPPMSSQPQVGGCVPSPALSVAPSVAPSVPGSPQPATAPSTSSSQKSAAPGSPLARRARNIALNFSFDPLQPETFVAVISRQHHHLGSRASIEDQALAVLCRGYAASRPARWTGVFSRLIKRPPSLLHVHEDAGALENIANCEERLLKRDKFITRIEDSSAGSSWALHVFSQIQVIRFALDWNTLNKRSKTAWFVVHFAFHHKEVHDQPDMYDYVTKTLAADFSKWQRNQLEPSVTGRNRLLDLYNFVSLFLHSIPLPHPTPLQFGAAVLVDPVWNILALGNSRSFTGLLPVLAGLVPGVDPIDTLKSHHASSVDALISAFTEVADARIADGVAQFFTDNPPAFDLAAYN